MKVLIIDDSRAMRMIIKRTIRLAGFKKATVEEASNGLEGLRMIEVSAPDLILCDLNMPEMSGLELLQKIKDRGLSVKMGIVTSDRSQSTRSQAMDGGALFVITKPFVPEHFKQAMDVALAGTDPAASGAVPASFSPGTAPFPTSAIVQRALDGLLPRDVYAMPGEPVPVDGKTPIVFGLYGENEDAIRVICLCDLRMAGNAGASMTLFPKGVVDAGVRSGRLHEGVALNMHEVFNVLGTLFGQNKLRSVHLPLVETGFDLEAMIGQPEMRLDLTIEIQGYGSGNLSLVQL